MLYSEYKSINEICGLICTAAEHMLSSNSFSLAETCLISLEAIEKILNINKDSVVSDKLFDILQAVKNQLMNEEPNFEAVLKNLNELALECQNGIYCDDGSNENLFARIDTDVLIIGTLENSRSCIKNFNENNVDFYMCDMFLDKAEQLDNKCFSLDRIDSFNYECIVITEKYSGDFFKNVLIEQYNIDNNKIIEYHLLYKVCVPDMIVDRVMMNPCVRSYDGMILGLSHTEVGIITDILDADFCNLSVSSQDIYYQLQTLKYCINTYPEKIKNLKYAVIDLFDYNYFNYDTSLAKTTVRYIADFGGYNKDAHNFNSNKNFDFTFEQLTESLKLEKYKGITIEHTDLWKKFFSKAFFYENYKYLNPNFDLRIRCRVVTDDEIAEWEEDRATMIRIFDDTINENKEALLEMLNTLRSINPDIKIYTLILPKYTDIEKRDWDKLSVHKKYFDEIICQLHKQCEFEHLDFKELSDLSGHREYYFDPSHLNFFGAYKATMLLNKIIFGK